MARPETGTSLRRLNQDHPRIDQCGSCRICRKTLRAKKGEILGSAARPRMSHKCSSSSRFIPSAKLNYLFARKLRMQTARKIKILSLGRLQEALQLANPCRVTHLAQGFRLNLANALPGDPEL